jgi:hypothetical protein
MQIAFKFIYLFIYFIAHYMHVIIYITYGISNKLVEFHALFQINVLHTFTSQCENEIFNTMWIDHVMILVKILKQP